MTWFFKTKAERFAYKKDFYQTREWLELRYRVLRYHGRRCHCCGATPSDGAVIQVDHIKPKSKFPKLCLSFRNCQPLCRACNLGKSNKYFDKFISP